jgi:hypothetical protein
MEAASKARREVMRWVVVVVVMVVVVYGELRW